MPKPEKSIRLNVGKINPSTIEKWTELKLHLSAARGQQIQNNDLFQIVVDEAHSNLDQIVQKAKEKRLKP